MFLRLRLLKVIAELHEKSLSGAYVLSPRVNLTHTLIPECLWSNSVRYFLIKIAGESNISPRNNPFFRAYMLST